MKTPVQFLAISGPKFMSFWDDVGNQYYSTIDH